MKVVEWWSGGEGLRRNEGLRRDGGAGVDVGAGAVDGGGLQSGWGLVVVLAVAPWPETEQSWTEPSTRHPPPSVVKSRRKNNSASPPPPFIHLRHRIMDLRQKDRALKLSHGILNICSLVLQLLWYFLHIIVSIWYSISAVANFCECYFISIGVLKKYKSLHLGNLRYLAIVIESENAHQTSKVVKLLKWLYSIGVKNVCLYDMNGVLKKSKEAIFQKMKNAKSIEDANEAVTDHASDHMTLEFVSYVDGKEAVAKAANLIFIDNLKLHNLSGELSETRLNEALQIVGCQGPEPDLLLVYGPVRCHLGFPAWRMRYTEIVHMESLNSMRYGSLIKAIYNYTKVRQNYGT